MVLHLNMMEMSVRKKAESDYKMLELVTIDRHIVRKNVCVCEKHIEHVALYHNPPPPTSDM